MFRTQCVCYFVKSDGIDFSQGPSDVADWGLLPVGGVYVYVPIRLGLGREEDGGGGKGRNRKWLGGEGEKFV